MKKILELLGFNFIHHIRYSYGIKLPLLSIAYFKEGFKKVEKLHYHNCTKTGIY